MKKCSSLLLFFIATTVLSQNVIKGKVTNKGGEPIAFASIGIPNSHVGTISEIDGGFELKIPEDLVSDSISFSSVGYQRITVPIQENMGFLDVVLADEVKKLSEVIVSSRRVKFNRRKTGNLHSKDGRFMTDLDYSGSAMAQLVTSPFDTTQIQWIRLGYFNKIENLELRVKFHQVGEDGRPGALLFDREIIVKLYEFEGVHKMEFDEFIYVTEKQFFVVLEPLILRKNREDLYNSLTSALKETPELMQVDEEGEMLIHKNDLPTNFFLFAVSQQKLGTAFYRTSSFDKWYDSEELSMVTGLLDVNEDLGFTVARVETEFAKAPTSIDVYKHSAGFAYTTIADYLRRVGSLTVEGTGNDIKVFVRGTASLFGNNEPIFVVDGAHIGRGYRSTIGLSPIQIKSVEVLRGPVQTARYGSAGSKGVILIRTVNSQ